MSDEKKLPPYVLFEGNVHKAFYRAVVDHNSERIVFEVSRLNDAMGKRVWNTIHAPSGDSVIWTALSLMAHSMRMTREAQTVVVNKIDDAAITELIKSSEVAPPPTCEHDSEF